MSTYCLHCRKSCEFKKDVPVEEIEAKNGRKMQRGVCAECGLKLVGFVKKAKEASDEEEKIAENAERKQNAL